MKIEDLHDKQCIVLTRDVKNPNADRRYKDDARRQAVFPEGMRFVVAPYGATHIVEGATVGPRLVLQPIDDAYPWLHRIDTTRLPDAFAAVVEAAAPTAMTPTALTVYLGCQNLSLMLFVRFLIGAGYFSLDQFERIWSAYEAWDPDEHPID